MRRIFLHARAVAGFGCLAILAVSCLCIAGMTPGHADASLAKGQQPPHLLLEPIYLEAPRVGTSEWQGAREVTRVVNFPQGEGTTVEIALRGHAHLLDVSTSRDQEHHAISSAFVTPGDSLNFSDGLVTVKAKVLEVTTVMDADPDKRTRRGRIFKSLWLRLQIDKAPTPRSKGKSRRRRSFRKSVTSSSHKRPIG